MHKATIISTCKREPHFGMVNRAFYAYFQLEDLLFEINYSTAFLLSNMVTQTFFLLLLQLEDILKISHLRLIIC